MCEDRACASVLGCFRLLAKRHMNPKSPGCPLCPCWTSLAIFAAASTFCALACSSCVLKVSTSASAESLFAQHCPYE
jgi:hypothetical protein